jgi:hypothetical protein
VVLVFGFVELVLVSVSASVSILEVDSVWFINIVMCGRFGFGFGFGF